MSKSKRNDRARYAMWKKGRFACIEAKEEGFFATPVIKFKGCHLKLNVKTSKTGNVRVEVIGIKSWIHKKKVEELIPGRSFEDSDPIEGDHLSHIVTWKGDPDLGHAEDQPIYLRFKLRSAKLYAFEFE